MNANNELKIALILILLFTMAGCSSHHGTPGTQTQIAPSAHSMDMNDQHDVQARLIQQYNTWYQAPYKMGGLSRNGVDCSGFTYLTFRDRLGYTIPRTTKSQVQIGVKVARDSLHIGDLVFFHTSIYSDHVGIYLGDSNFLHASTSKGVMISTLNQEYWAERYWTARRVGK